MLPAGVWRPLARTVCAWLPTPPTCPNTRPGQLSRVKAVTPIHRLSHHPAPPNQRPLQASMTEQCHLDSKLHDTTTTITTRRPTWSSDDGPGATHMADKTQPTCPHTRQTQLPRLKALRHGNDNGHRPSRHPTPPPPNPSPLEAFSYEQSHVDSKLHEASTTTTR